VHVDLRSDTVTRPTPAMRAAMASAEVGDDVFGDDPTVRALEAASAERAGKAAALFVPSGTQANLLAIAVQTRPGDEVMMHEEAHPFLYEGGGAAAIAGVQIRPLPGPRGLIDPRVIAPHVRRGDVHFAPTTLLCIEDTANRGGGVVHPLATLDALTEAAAAAGLGRHLDGARAWNAVVASGVPLARRAAGFDTVAFCFSKGLGAPVGSVLCGRTDAIAEARRWRKRLGGGMRQAGVLAAAALHALHHHIDRLADDHARAQRLADALRDAGATVAQPETNLVYVDVDDAPRWVSAAAAHGVHFLATSPTRARLVLHLDVDDAALDHAIHVLRAALAG
jgi:threonine aldolase